MPLPTETKILQLKDVKIAELTTDADPPVYGNLIDVPGIQTLEVTPHMEEVELRGDDQILDIWARVDYIEWSWKNAKVPLDVFKLLLGGSVALSGTAPNQKQVYSLGGTDKPVWFKLEGQAVYVEEGLGDVHVVLCKCKCTGGAGFTLGDGFALVTAKGKAIPLAVQGKLIDIVFNETATEIA